MTEYNGRVGAHIVLAFFIVSGFFFKRSLDSSAKNDFFVLQRIIRLWPVLAFSLLVNFNGVFDFLNLFFISSGLGVIMEGSSNPASWYICNLFWITIIYYEFLKNVSPRESKVNAILLLLTIAALSLISHRQTSGLYSALVSEHIPFLTNGNTMGIAGFSIGILFAQHKTIYKIKSRTFVLFCQLLTTGYCIYIHGFCNKIYTTLYYMLIFLVAMYFLVYQEGIQTFRQSHVFRALGAYSYAIYMMQFPCFYYYRKIIARGLLSNASPEVLVILGISMCIIVGVVVYHIIERPVGSFLGEKLKLINEACTSKVK